MEGLATVFNVLIKVGEHRDLPNVFSLGGEIHN